MIPILYKEIHNIDKWSRKRIKHVAIMVLYPDYEKLDLKQRLSIKITGTTEELKQAILEHYETIKDQIT